MRHPGDDVRVLRVREDFEELGWKGGAGRWPSSTARSGTSGCIRTHSKRVVAHVNRLQHQWKSNQTYSNVMLY